MLHPELANVAFFNYMEKCGFMVGFPTVTEIYVVKMTAPLSELTVHIRDCLLLMEKSSGPVYVRSYDRANDQFTITVGVDTCQPRQVDVEILKCIIECNLQSRLSDLLNLLSKSGNV